MFSSYFLALFAGTLNKSLSRLVWLLQERDFQLIIPVVYWVTGRCGGTVLAAKGISSSE